MAEALLKMAERVARLSAWRVELPGFTPTWSDGVRAIHELPEGFVPILDRVIDTYVPEDRPVLRAAVAECAGSGKPFDLELRVIRGTGRSGAFEAWFEPLASWLSVPAYRSPQGLAIYFYNVTKQREAREARQLEEWLNSLEVL